MRAKILANIVLAVLERLTVGQGHATIEVFNAGAGGGFNYGYIHIELLRDGAFFKRKVFDRAEFLELLAGLIKSRYNWYR